MKRTIPITILILLLSLMGCSRKSMMRNYYLLTPSSIPASGYLLEVIGEPLPYKVDVRDFQVVRAFEQTRMAVRSKSNELNYYYYHHWSVRPSALIPDMVHFEVSRSGLFQECKRGFTHQPDYIIQGRITQVERVHTGEVPCAHIAGNFEFFNEEKQSIVLKHNFDRTAPLMEDETMNSFARTLSDVIQHEISTFQLKIVDYFQASSPKESTE